MKLETLLKRYHFKDTKELDEFLRIMKNSLYVGSLEYSKNCHTPNIELLNVHCDYDNTPTPNYKFVKEWIDKNKDGKHYKDVGQRAKDKYFKKIEREVAKKEKNNELIKMAISWDELVEE